uniref:ChrR family anti-sigma-E factor n=1 Tax=Ningiella ruwaisensis TaxID=2364274 RepID=UPI00109FFB43|nr:ChrR family anti-sigma-E factor [Ningiella ruwaisensis]
MIRFHPTSRALAGFAEGLIAPNESLVVSAHCDMCHSCRNKVKTMAESVAQAYLSEPSQTSNAVDNELANMFDAIVSRPEIEIRSKRTSADFRKTVKVNGKSFTVPQSLQRYAASMGSWSQLIGKLWQAPVMIGGKNLANFIYMEKGGSVPEHTHIGNELTLVIDGTFSDGLNAYETGDFIALSTSDTHTPAANMHEGCLVFSIIDEPLHFTSGWAKLINPLSHLYFKVSTKN